MKVIAAGRQTGRTTQLIRQAADEHLYIVCPNMERVRNIARMARAVELDIPFPLTWDEFAGRRFSVHGCRGFLIDDLDHCLQSTAGPVPIKTVVFEDTDATAAGIHEYLHMETPGEPLAGEHMLGEWAR